MRCERFGNLLRAGATYDDDVGTDSSSPWSSRVRLLVSAVTHGGTLEIRAKPVNGSAFVDGTRGTLRVVLQRENGDAAGITIRNETSGTAAYVHGTSLMHLARELGFTIR